MAGSGRTRSSGGGRATNDADDQQLVEMPGLARGLAHRRRGGGLRRGRRRRPSRRATAWRAAMRPPESDERRPARRGSSAGREQAELEPPEALEPLQLVDRPARARRCGRAAGRRPRSAGSRRGRPAARRAARAARPSSRSSNSSSRAAVERARGALGVRAAAGSARTARRQRAHDDVAPLAAAGRRSARAAACARSPAGAARGSAAPPRARPRAPSRASRHSIRSTAPSAASTEGRWRSRAEVRAQPRAQVARLADVEHLVVPVAEEVDAGPRRARRARGGACRGRGAGAAPPAPRARRPCARRAPARARSGATKISAVACASGSARWHGCDRHAEEVRERGEARPLDAPAQQVARERDRVEHGRGEPLARSAARARG